VKNRGVRKKRVSEIHVFVHLTNYHFDESKWWPKQRVITVVFLVCSSVFFKHVYFISHDSLTLDINPRTFHQKKLSIYSDEFIVLSDCQGRMSDYSYAMYADTDEFIIPDVADLKGSWVTFAVNVILISHLTLYYDIV